MEIKLKLKVRDIEIELTKDEAVKLKDLLNELTGEEIVKEKEYVPYYPYTPYLPWWVRPDTYITCGNTWVWDTDNTCNIARISDDVQVTYAVS